MQEIEKEICEIYDLEIRNSYPVKDFFIIETSSGKKVFKRVNFSPERILFIHGAKEHLHKNGFINIDRYLCTREGKPYADVNGINYTIAEAASGRECNLDNREDVIKASKALAMLHSASRGYIPPKNSLVRDDLGNLPNYFNKRLDEIKRVKKIAQREKGKFDYLILKYIDYFYSLGEEAVEKIYCSKYSEIVERTKKEGIFCHHDFTHCNIICDENKTFVINFDFVSHELKVYDVANLLRRKMRKCSWDINEAKVIIDAYTSIEPISNEEFYIMNIMLQFPQKFWRVINKYYNSRRTWREKNFFNKFEEVTGEIEHHKKFLEAFDMLFL